jgi:hypothetical protein
MIIRAGTTARHAGTGIGSNARRVDLKVREALASHFWASDTISSVAPRTDITALWVPALAASLHLRTPSDARSFAAGSFDLIIIPMPKTAATFSNVLYGLLEVGAAGGGTAAGTAGGTGRAQLSNTVIAARPHLWNPGNT